MRLAVVALLLLAACAPKVNDPSSPDFVPSDEPFPDQGPHAAKPPLSGRCVSDIDCKANGMECLHEGKGKAGTCVRMDPAVGPNGVPAGPCLGGHC